MKIWFYILLMAFGITSCARVGSPVGGTKDTLAPQFTGANIDSSRVNVSQNLKELRLNFDEYITLKEISKNLTISPPIKKIKKILPSTLGNKYVLVQWEDTLKANTTYNFNFGNAIADLNEGNVLPYFNYAFSTGDKLDNLYISGEVTDALLPALTPEEQSQSKKTYVVGLYQDNNGNPDYRQKPYYATKADSDGYFELNYLSPGSYRILSFEDENQNSVYDQGKEAVSFSKDKIELSQNISGMKLRVAPSRKKVKFLEGKEQPGGVLLLFEGKPEHVEIMSINEKLTDYQVTHRLKSDSVSVWFDAMKQNIGQAQNENLKFDYKADTLKGTASVFYRMNPKNELTISNASSSQLAPNRDFIITANYPLTKIDTEKWTLKKDSITENFSAKISELNPMQILVSAKFEPGKKYQLTVPSKTVASYYSQLAKPYQFNFEIDREENFGSLTLTLENAPPQKHWIQLLNEKGDIAYSQTGTGNKVKLTELKPGRYRLRILVDNNGNGYWDEADFSAQTYAEDVYFFSKVIEIRPLWENVETWNLKPANDENPK